MTRTILDLFPVTVSQDATGSLALAGHSLAALARHFGTPLYLYDAQTIEGQVKSITQLLQQHYPAAVDVTYAAKAYFSLGMARHLARLGLGVDVVSLGELRVAQKAGFAPERVHLHGNNKSESDLVAAVEWGVQAIVVDSLEELTFLDRLCARLRRTARIWLRVTPGIQVAKLLR